MPNIADVPLGQGWPAELNETVEQEGPVLTDHEILALKHAIYHGTGLNASCGCDSVATKQDADNASHLIYVAGDLERHRQHLVSIGYVASADIIDEAIVDIMRQWFEDRGRR